MQAQETLSEPSIEQISERIFTSRRISRADQRWLMSAMLSKESLSPDDSNLITRLFSCLQKGTIRVVD